MNQEERIRKSGNQEENGTHGTYSSHSLLPAWTDSPLLVWGIAAAALILAAFCLASLSWDGSYYLLHTVQKGEPMIPHRRWLNWMLQQPVLWAVPFVKQPVHLAVIHGLTCALLPLLSLAVCLRLLRGEFARLRFWVVLGILIAPLPGQLLLVGEVNPALQLSWVCLAFVWRGCPSRWTPVIALTVAAMLGLHPVAAPLFVCVAATSTALGFAIRQRQVWAWAAFFGICAVVKTAETLGLASDYERSNLHGAAWLAECRVGLQMTPAVILIPILIGAVLLVAATFRPAIAKSNAFRCGMLLIWGTAFYQGLVHCVASGGWTGGLAYRKFGILVTVPLVILAGLEAWRHWRKPKETASLPTCGRALLIPTLLFAVLLGAMSLSWKSLCTSLAAQLAASSGPIHLHENLSPTERDSALNHWSTTSLSLILQGWEPRKVHVWNRELQLPAKGFCVCPEDTYRCEDKAFKLGWLAKLPTSPAKSAP